MRSLSRNERTLGLALGSCVFLLANMFGIRWIIGELREWRAGIEQLDMQVAVSRELLNEAPYWKAREAWMAENPPPPFNESTSAAEFVQEIQSSLRQRELEIRNLDTYPPEFSGSLATVDVRFKVQGRLEAIVRWLHALQQPGQYIVVRNFVLNQASGSNTMELEIRLGRVFRTGDIASSP